MTTDNEKTEGVESNEESKSFFARGAALGLIGGALVALLVISVAGTVVSLFDDLFGSTTTVAAEEPVELDPVVAQGMAVANDAGCAACHSVDGVDGAGPSWQGIGSQRDAEYILTSIINPNDVIAAGFTEGVMPTTYSDTLSAEELDALVAYLLSL